MAESVIVAGARTPNGKFMGGFAEVSAQDLGASAIKAALDRATVDPGVIDYVIMGQVLQAGQGQITARVAATKAGIGMSIPAITINKVCLSGINAIALADQLIRAGEVTTVVAGGMESMTRTPYAVPSARTGARMGNAEQVDLMIHDGLWCAFDHTHMGEGTDIMNTKLGISRLEQDEWAARSHERAADAAKAGRLADEISAVEVQQRKAEALLVEEDEGIRPGTTVESLAKLRPAFTKDGTITAGNASQISDGAAAVIVTSKENAEKNGWPVLATILGHGMVAGPGDASLPDQPANAIRKVAEKLGQDPSGFDLYEINEAFASVAIRSTKQLGVSEDKVNVNGGAVALGHPIGASGARLVLTTAHELQRRGGGVGVAALCGGGGQGDALLIRVN
ncbi:MAG TPA: acetyl-CoA C-acetyltransferase [Actinomycetota bacterium]|nr:acetyl-CoA C-acetyltransferase [Actinomycetota bacterium]